jgi:hypothetical protein
VPAEQADVTTLDDDETFDEDVAEADVLIEDDPDELEDDADDALFDQDALDEEDEPDAATEHADLVPPAVPVVKPSRRAHRAEMKGSARKVRRVVRHIDPWSVFKVASLFIMCVWGVVVLASLLIWRAAVSAGSVDNTEKFITDIGFTDFDFDPEKMFRALLSAGAVAAVFAIFFIVLLTFLFNLICDMTGGVRVTMIEQDLADARKRRGRKAQAED